MSLKAKLAEIFDINQKNLAMYPEVVAKQAFFARLSSHGVVPTDDANAEEMYQAGIQLQSKLAGIREATAAQSPVNVGLQMILGQPSVKQAALPDQSDRAAAAQAILHSMLQDAPTFAAGLTHSS